MHTLEVILLGLATFFFAAETVLQRSLVAAGLMMWALMALIVLTS